MGVWLVVYWSFLIELEYFSQNPIFQASQRKSISQGLIFVRKYSIYPMQNSSKEIHNFYLFDCRDDDNT